MGPEQPVLRIAPAPRRYVGLWPVGLRDPVFVLTVWNPGDSRFSVDENRARQVALESELSGMTAGFWPAVGWAEDSNQREESVAVTGVTESEAVALGARYGQVALFAWTPAAWCVVSCIGDRRIESGWSLRQKSPAPPPY